MVTFCCPVFYVVIDYVNQNSFVWKFNEKKIVKCLIPFVIFGAFLL